MVSKLEHQRISTTYSLPLDPSTVALLAGAPLGSVEDVSAIQLVRLDERKSRLLYVVPWQNDNEYVHKALRRNLRTWINANKRVLAALSEVKP
jgi:hypothetical protein